MLRVKFGIDIEPGLRGIVLMFLKIGYQVVNNCRELVSQIGKKYDSFGPDGKAGATFWGIKGANGNIHHPC